MQDLLNSKSNDEIDLRELFMALWAYKLFITCTCALGIVFSGYYALNLGKKFTSAAIFKLDQAPSSSGFSVGEQFSTLANLAGLGSVGKSTTLPTDQVNGRIFIEKLDKTLNFQTDPYFNTYNPNPVDPIWKSLIKSAIGWQKSPIDAQEAIWQNIVERYSKNIMLKKTEDGSIKIKVTHVNPQRAAEIANTIMNEVIYNVKNKKNTIQDEQLAYLSNTLAKALSDLEVSQSKLKDFTLENGALPLENFTAGSFQLDKLREQFKRTSELHEAVAALSLVLKDKTTDQNNYLALRQKFPIVDQAEFRRVLGQNEIISFWSWPEASTIDAVFDTLTEGKSRLETKINALQINAEQSSLALATYAKLEREAKVAEATYTVLIEQVKAQSMVAGFRPDKTEVYEYASASVSPSEPKRNVILAFGAIIGLIVGVALSLIWSFAEVSTNSKNSLISGAQARLTASVRTLLPLRYKSLGDVNTILVKKPHPVLRNLAVEIHKSAATQVVVTSSHAKMTGNDVARALASYMQSDTMKVAVIDFSSRAKKLDIDEKKQSVKSFDITECVGHVSVLIPGDNLSSMELLSHKDFWEKIQTLNSTFDLIFLCADNSDAISLLSALEGQKMFHIALARTKNTKSAILEQMCSFLPIQGLLHD